MATKQQEEQLKQVQSVADKRVPILQASFIAAVEEIKLNLFEAKNLENALMLNNVDAAVLATQIENMESLLFGIGLNDNGFIFSNKLTETFNLGALDSIQSLSSELRQAITYDSLAERAVRQIRTNGVQVIRGLSDASKVSVRNLIERLMDDGIPPAKMARQIRSLIGLTSDQAQSVVNFRQQLTNRQVLGFTNPAERRLDAIEQTLVRRHMKLGTMSDKQIDEMVDKYAQRLLNKRALDIARTESLHSVNQGRAESWQQGYDQGVFGDNYRKFWLTAQDERVRVTHRAIPAMNVGGVKLNAWFLAPWGTVFSPGDYSPNLINCRCSLYIQTV